MRRLAIAALVGVVLTACADDAVRMTDDPISGNTSTGNTATGNSTTRDTASGTPATAGGPSTVPLADGAVTLTDVAGGINLPVDLVWRADDPTIYVVGQRGVVVPIRDGVVGAPVLDVSSMISDGGEQGLLALEFHPTLPYAYADLTDRDGNTQVVEFPVSDASDGSAVFDLDGRRIVLTVDQPYQNHNGGDLLFDADGHLLISLGDGGSADDPDRHALDTSSLLGKLLRIDPRPSADGRPYSVPSDNPFAAAERPEIWSVGLRNPWRIDRDPLTGELWVADVGQGSWEEVTVVADGRGVNFGWSAFEGSHRFNDDQSPDGGTPPLYEYPHGSDGCSISGGMVYRGAAVPSLDGWFVFSDYCSGRLVALRRGPDGGAQTVTLLEDLGAVSAVRRGPDGEAYVLTIDAGTVRRVSAALP